MANSVGGFSPQLVPRVTKADDVLSLAGEVIKGGINCRMCLIVNLCLAIGCWFAVSSVPFKIIPKRDVNKVNYY